MKAVLALCAAAGVATAQLTPKVKTERGSLVLQARTGSHVTVRTDGAADITLDTLPADISSQIAASASTINAGIASSAAGTTATLRAEMAAGLSSAMTPVSSQIASLVTDLNAVPGQVTSSIMPTVNRMSSTMAAQSATTAAAVSRAAVSTLANARTGSTNAGRIATALNRLAEAEAAINNASTCALQGQHYNRATGACYGAQTLLGPPDWESEWTPMQSNSGSSAFTFRQFTHNLRADPEVVKVVAMYTGGGPLSGHLIEGVGAGICDDDASNGCNEYGGFVYAYNNVSIRVWLPEQNNGPRLGHTFMFQDGWSCGLYNMQSDGRANEPIMFKAYVWRKYRQDNSNADFSRSINMRSRSSAAYAEVAHNLGQYPERVSVMVEAVDGPNRGYKFPARGNSMVDDDNSKQYGGLVFAYNNQRVRLWAPTGPGGRLLSTHDGWGGEAFRANSDAGRVHIKAWRNEIAPSFASPWLQMCANAAAWTRSSSRSCNLANRYSSFRRVEHGLGKVPRRVVVQLRARSGANNGYIFEATGSGVDDEHDDRSGSMMTYDTNYVHIYAPTRNNGRYDGRFLGVYDGWGGGRNQAYEICGYARVLAWAD